MTSFSRSAGTRAGSNFTYTCFCGTLGLTSCTPGTVLRAVLIFEAHPSQTHTRNKNIHVGKRAALDSVAAFEAHAPDAKRVERMPVHGKTTDSHQLSEPDVELPTLVR